MNEDRANSSPPHFNSPAPGFVPFDKAEIEQSIAHRFERQVERFADRPAIRDRGLTLTYEALNRAANHVAHAILARRGQGPEPIALLLEPGIMVVATILGILKAGKFYVALDPSYPRPWFATLLDHSDAPLLVTNFANLPLASTLIRRPEQVLKIDDFDAELSNVNPELPISPNSLAYLCYTSGSTGSPKGVMQTHRNMLHQIAGYTNGLELSARDHCTLLHSHSFSASRLDIFGALLNGAVLLPFSVGKEGTANLALWLLEQEATIFHWVPTGFRHLVDTLDETGQFPKVRAVILGSEPVSLRDVASYKRHFGPTCVLANRFGTTETGNISWFFMRKDTALTDNIVPVGYAVEDTEVLVLDDKDKEVRCDLPGEIVVKSNYLSPGYWQGTAPGFASNVAKLGKRTYRTGDMGCMRPDGCLVHLGRKDLQAKIRGHRVELAQVECALLAHPAVREAAAVVREDRPEERRLVAYIVRAGDSPPSSTALRDFLKTRIPDYMIPADFVPLKSFPLTPGGKLNRRALPDPATARLGPDAPLAEPNSPIEKIIAGIWKEALGVKRVGLNDTFLDLGGHSLLASTIISRITEEFKVEISIREFFEQPTVAQIADRISRNQEVNFADVEMLRVMSEIESLRDDEADRLLQGNQK